MKVVVITLVLLIVTPSFATDKWTKADTARQIAFTTLTVVDWGQTRYISKSDDFYELNPLLGKNPSRDEVDKHFLIAITAHAVISYLLPRDYRKVWQYIFIGTEGAVVTRNHAIGVRMDF